MNKSKYTTLDVILDCYEAMLDEYSHVRWFHLSWEERNCSNLSESDKDELEKQRAEEAMRIVDKLRHTEVNI